MADDPTVPPFSSTYDKARRSYGFIAGLCLAWELIGIDVGQPLSTYGVTFKSPQALPFVLFALMVYFGFRFTVEWYQADQTRRMKRVSRVDNLVAHSIAVSALLVAAIQGAYRIQLASYFTEPVREV